MAVERVDYSNEEEYQQALQMEEGQAAQVEAEANIPQEEPPEELPF